MASSSRRRRRAKSNDAGHLVNFKLPARPIQPRAPPVRHRGVGSAGAVAAGGHISKGQFLQANYQFVVNDSGDYTACMFDPDVLVPWEHVELVRKVTTSVGECPICLYPPCAPKITQCGHVFCWACVLQYLAMEQTTTRKCPLCLEHISVADLKSFAAIETSTLRPGSQASFTLLKRARSSVVGMPRSAWRASMSLDNLPPALHCFAHLVVSADVAPILAREREALQTALSVAQCVPEEADAVPYLSRALDLLDEREQVSSMRLRQRRARLGDGSDAITNTQPQSRRRRATSGAAAAPDYTLRASRDASPAVTRAVSSAPSAATAASSSTSAYQVVFRRGGGGDVRTGKTSGRIFDFGDDLGDDEFDDDDVDDGFHGDDDDADYNGANAGDPVGDDDGDSTADRLPRQDVVRDPWTGQVIPPASPSSPVASATSSLTSLPSPPSQPAQLGDVPGDASRGDEAGFYYYFQSTDGQPYFLHPFNVRQLTAQYGSFERFPETLSAHVIELEPVRQTEAARKRFRYLGHLPLACEYVLCEVDLRNVLSDDVKAQFRSEFRARARRRARHQRSEEQQSQEAARRTNESMIQDMETSRLVVFEANPARAPLSTDTSMFPVLPLTDAPADAEASALPGSQEQQADGTDTVASGQEDAPSFLAAARSAAPRSQTPQQLVPSATDEHAFPSLGAPSASTRQRQPMVPLASGRGWGAGNATAATLNRQLMQDDEETLVAPAPVLSWSVALSSAGGGASAAPTTTTTSASTPVGRGKRGSRKGVRLVSNGSMRRL